MVSPLPELVTHEEVMRHLSLLHLLGSPDNDEAEWVMAYAEAATSIVVEYLDRDDDDWTDTMLAWTSSTVPKAIKAAVLVQCAELYRFRGDDPNNIAPAREPGMLSPMVRAYLARFHDPTVA